MRDIRSDLMERLELIQSERRALANQLRAFDNEESAVKALLDAENRRFHKKETILARLSIREPERTKKPLPPPPMYGVQDFVIKILADRKTLTLDQLKNLAEEGNLVLGEKASLGRTIHGALLGLLKQGRVEQVETGVWKIVEREASPAVTDEAPQ